MNGSIATWVEYIPSPSNAHAHFNEDSMTIEIMAYVQREKVLRAQYEILNFENAFSVIQIASKAERVSTATFFMFDAEIETTRKSGPKVPNVWNPTTCRKNASANAAAVRERTKPTNEIGNPAYATLLNAFLNPVPPDVFQKSISDANPAPTNEGVPISMRRFDTFFSVIAHILSIPSCSAYHATVSERRYPFPSSVT